MRRERDFNVVELVENVVYVQISNYVCIHYFNVQNKGQNQRIHTCKYDVYVLRSNVECKYVKYKYVDTFIPTYGAST